MTCIFLSYQQARPNNIAIVHSFIRRNTPKKVDPEVSDQKEYLITVNKNITEIEHLNSFSASGGENLNKNFPKIQMPGGLPGGDVEASIWLVHNDFVDEEDEARLYVYLQVYLLLHSDVTSLQLWNHI